MQGLRNLREPILKQRPHLSESFGIGPLKRVNRLFFIAHDKHGSRGLAILHACVEFFGQYSHDIPLRGRSILRFVHQNVVDPAVKTIQNPCCHVGTPQQRAGLLDQIFEVQLTEQRFASVIPPKKFTCKIMQRACPLKRFTSQPLIPRDHHAVFQLLHHFTDPRVFVRHGLGRKPPRRFCCTRSRQIKAFIQIQRSTRRDRQAAANFQSKVLIL